MPLPFNAILNQSSYPRFTINSFAFGRPGAAEVLAPCAARLPHRHVQINESAVTIADRREVSSSGCLSFDRYNEEHPFF